MQSADPSSGLYLPFEHASQIPFTPVYPALQKHRSRAEAPDLDVELAGHSKQADDSNAPSTSLYVPGSQTVHGIDPFDDLKVPAAQALHDEGELLV